MMHSLANLTMIRSIQSLIKQEVRRTRRIISISSKFRILLILILNWSQLFNSISFINIQIKTENTAHILKIIQITSKPQMLQTHPSRPWNTWIRTKTTCNWKTSKWWTPTCWTTLTSWWQIQINLPMHGKKLSKIHMISCSRIVL